MWATPSQESISIPKKLVTGEGEVTLEGFTMNPTPYKLAPLCQYCAGTPLCQWDLL